MANKGHNVFTALQTPVYACLCHCLALITYLETICVTLAVLSVNAVTHRAKRAFAVSRRSLFLLAIICWLFSGSVASAQ